MCGEHSVTVQIANLRQSETPSDAYKFIWARYFARLAGLAQKRLGGTSQRVVSGEDVAASVLATFFRRMNDSPTAFPELCDRTYLWPLLAKIAQRKAIKAYHKEKRAHLDGRLRGDSVRLAEHGDVARLDNILEGELTSESADAVFANCCEMLEVLKVYDRKFDPPRTNYYQIALATLKGYSANEVAGKLGYQNKKSVERALTEIRVIWKCVDGGLAKIRVKTFEKEFATDIARESVILGRQRKDEPPPIWDGVFNYEGEVVRRLVASNDRRVSRNHCSISIQDEINIVVKNISRKSVVIVSGQRLNAGDETTTTKDCVVRLPEIDVSVSLT